MSKCVYLASIGVKIEHTVFFSKYISDDHASRNMCHNQSKKCENVCVCPSKLNGIHAKLN